MSGSLCLKANLNLITELWLINTSKPKGYQLNISQSLFRQLAQLA